MTGLADRRAFRRRRGDRRDRDRAGGGDGDPCAVARAAFRRFPAAPVEHLGEDRRGDAHASSSTRVSPRASCRSAARSRRCSSASSRSRSRSATSGSRRRRMQGLASLSAPARLILLTEQTRDWARGRPRRFCRRAALHDRRGAADGGRRAAGVRPHAVARPVLYGADYAGAANAARLVLVAGGAPVRVRLVEVAPGLDRPAEPARARARDRVGRDDPARPRARRRVGRDRRRRAVLASTVVFCLVWVVLCGLARARAPAAAREAAA